MATHRSRYDRPEQVEEEVRRWSKSLRMGAKFMRQGVTQPYTATAFRPVTVPANRQAREWGAETLERAAAILVQALEKRKLAKEIEKTGT